MSWTENHGFSMFGQYNLSLLGIDQAWLNITNLSKQKLWLYQLSSDCFKCPFVAVDTFVNPGECSDIIVSTKFPTRYRLYSDGTPEIVPDNSYNTGHCEMSQETSKNMGEFGIYELHAYDDRCNTSTMLESVNIHLPLLIAFFFYLALTVILTLWKKYEVSIYAVLPFKTKNQLTSITEPGEAEANSSKVTSTSGGRARLRSLDTFRGICIVIMIFVNDGGAGYYFLEHATWDGLYVADLVFPWFLWIMGVCIPVSIKSQVKRGTSKFTIFRRILVRSLKLIAIGVILNSKGGPIEFNKLRLPGVLQRFGICYLVAASSVLICANDDFVNNRKPENKYIASLQDIFFIWKGWIISLAVILLHSLLTFFLKVPGCPTMSWLSSLLFRLKTVEPFTFIGLSSGYLGPGGLHEDGAYPDYCIGGAAGYIDRQILTSKHIYQWPTAIGTYRAAAYDPEGLLGTLTSIFTVWLGIQTGLTMLVYPKHQSRLIRWAAWAVVLGALGAALCGAKETGGPIPLNKNLWSLSFSLVLSSFALILLMILYVSIDILKIWSGTPFFEPGMNSILLYIGHSVANDMLPWHFRLKSMNTHFKTLIESLWGTSLWAIYAIYLFHKKFFWSL